MAAHALIKDPTFINACVRTASAERIVKVSCLLVDQLKSDLLLNSRLSSVGCLIEVIRQGTSNKTLARACGGTVLEFIGVRDYTQLNSSSANSHVAVVTYLVWRAVFQPKLHISVSSDQNVFLVSVGQ